MTKEERLELILAHCTTHEQCDPLNWLYWLNYDQLGMTEEEEPNG